MRAKLSPPLRVGIIVSSLAAIGMLLSFAPSATATAPSYPYSPPAAFFYDELVDDGALFVQRHNLTLAEEGRDAPSVNVTPASSGITLSVGPAYDGLRSSIRQETESFLGSYNLFRHRPNRFC